MSDLAVSTRVCVITEGAPLCRTGKIVYRHLNLHLGVLTLKGYAVRPDTDAPDAIGYNWEPSEIVTIEVFEAAVQEFEGDTERALRELRARALQ